MKNVYQTVFQLVFIAVAFVFVLILALGISFSPDKLTQLSFWALVVCQLAVLLFVYNIIISLDQKNRLLNEKNKYFQAKATNEIRIDKIYKDKRYEDLEAAVDKENKTNFINKCNYILHKKSTRISYDDLFEKDKFKSLEEINKLFDGFMYTKKEKKKLFKVVKKIINGKVKSVEITPDDLLQDRENESLTKSPLIFSDRQILIKTNSKRTVKFLISVLVTASISFSLTSPNFWEELIKNFTLFGSAIISGFSASAMIAKIKTAVYTNRNNFFVRHLDIKDEYTPTEN